jgi:hypothetical protein
MLHCGLLFSPATSGNRRSWTLLILCIQVYVVLGKNDLCYESTVAGHRVIKVAGVPIGPTNEFLLTWRPTFEQYLSDTVGKNHNPPLVFSLVSSTLSDVFDIVNAGKVHFVYSNPSLYSCLEAEFSGNRCTFFLNKQ